MKSPEHDKPVPDIDIIQCPIATRIACMYWFNRNELAKHISAHHPDYHEDPEPYFEAERERRFK